MATSGVRTVIGQARWVAASTGPLEEAVASVGDRWTLLIIDALLAGPLRFGQLESAIAGIAPNILTARLRHLDREGLVIARAYSHRPPRMAYELTASGLDLAGALALLTSWGARRGGADESRHHDACGTAVETRAWCPTCERVLDDGEAGELHHL